MWNARKQDAVNGGRSMEVTKVTGYQFCLNTNLQIRQIIKNTQKTIISKVNKTCNQLITVN